MHSRDSCPHYSWALAEFEQNLDYKTACDSLPRSQPLQDRGRAWWSRKLSDTLSKEFTLWKGIQRIDYENKSPWREDLKGEDEKQSLGKLGWGRVGWGMRRVPKRGVRSLNNVVGLRGPVSIRDLLGFLHWCDWGFGSGHCGAGHEWESTPIPCEKKQTNRGVR